MFCCKTSLRLSLLEIHPHLYFPLKSQEVICAPCIHFHPHNSRAFKRGNSFSVFQKTFHRLMPLLLLYYPFILSAITSTSFSVALYIVGEMKWKLFFFFFWKSWLLSLFPHLCTVQYLPTGRALNFPDWFMPHSYSSHTDTLPLTCDSLPPTTSYETDAVSLQEHKPSWRRGSFVQNLKKFCFWSQMKSCSVFCPIRTNSICKQEWGCPGGYL